MTNRLEEDQTRLTLLWMCSGYRGALALISGLELDLFSHIPDEGATDSAIAAAVDIPPTAARLLLDVLVNTDLVTKRSGRYHVAPECAAYLRRGPGYIGQTLLSQKVECEYWLHAADILRGTYTGPLLIDRKYEGELAPSTLDTIAWNNRSYPDLLWQALAPLVPKVRRALDIGAGRGYFSRALLELNDRVEVTILDNYAGALESCRASLAGHRGLPRVRFELADAMSLSREGDADLVMLNDVLHYFGRQQKLDLLRRAYRALEPGGTCLEVGFSLVDGCTPAGSASFSFRMYLHTMRAYLATDDETVALFREAGFREVTCRPLDDKRLVTGVR